MIQRILPNWLMYRLMYWLGQARWDSGVTPPEVVEAYKTGDIPPGPALDLGCGTGTNVIYMASLGQQAIGVDFVPSAISKARKKAQQVGVSSRAQFFIADVTRLAELKLPRCAFALDMGCFHSLNADGQRRYLAGLSSLLVPGGLYMLYTMDPRPEAGRSFGIAPEQVQTVFSPAFDIQRVERGEFRRIGSTWFWMRRKA